MDRDYTILGWNWRRLRNETSHSYLWEDDTLHSSFYLCVDEQVIVDDVDYYYSQNIFVAAV